MRHLLWERADGPGLEHLSGAVRADGVVADGVILATDDGVPFRLRYRIECDATWATRDVRIWRLDEAAAPALALRADRGIWTDGAGAPLPALAGCIDIDLTATPFTNSLPIRRLALPAGASRELGVVWSQGPALTFEAARQRYTCVARDAAGERWRYEGEATDGGAYAAEVRTDADGFVVEYPGLFRRVR